MTQLSLQPGWADQLTPPVLSGICSTVCFEGQGQSIVSVFGNVHEKYRVGLNRVNSFFETFLISWARHFFLHDNTFFHLNTKEPKNSDCLPIQKTESEADHHTYFGNWPAVLWRLEDFSCWFRCISLDWVPYREGYMKMPLTKQKELQQIELFYTFYFSYNTFKSRSNLSYFIGSHKERDRDIKEYKGRDSGEHSVLHDKWAVLANTVVQKQSSSELCNKPWQLSSTLPRMWLSRFHQA